MTDSAAGGMTGMDELGDLLPVAERVAASALRPGEDGFAARSEFRASGRAALLETIGIGNGSSAERRESPAGRTVEKRDGSFAALRMTEEGLGLTTRGLGLWGSRLGAAEDRRLRIWPTGRLNRRVAAMALAAALPLMIGGCAVAASQEAVPGDALYQIKLGRDGLEITMARGEPARAEAYGRVAERRVLDAQRAEVLGRTQEAEEALARAIETRVQAEEIRARLAPERPAPPLPPSPPAPPAAPDARAIRAQAEAQARAQVAPFLERAMLFRETSAALGMTPSQLGREVLQGKPLAETASARGVDEDGLLQLVQARVQGHTVAGRQAQVSSFSALEAAVRVEAGSLSLPRSSDSWWDRLGDVVDRVFGRLFERVEERIRL